MLRADTHMAKNKEETKKKDNPIYFISTIFKFCYCFPYKGFYKHVKTVHSMNVP